MDQEPTEPPAEQENTSPPPQGTPNGIAEQKSQENVQEAKPVPNQAPLPLESPQANAANSNEQSVPVSQPQHNMATENAPPAAPQHLPPPPPHGIPPGQPPVHHHPGNLLFCLNSLRFLGNRQCKRGKRLYKQYQTVKISMSVNIPHRFVSYYVFCSIYESTYPKFLKFCPKQRYFKIYFQNQKSY